MVISEFGLSVVSLIVQCFSNNCDYGGGWQIQCIVQLQIIIFVRYLINCMVQLYVIIYLNGSIVFNVIKYKKNKKK